MLRVTWLQVEPAAFKTASAEEYPESIGLPAETAAVEDNPKSIGLPSDLGCRDETLSLLTALARDFISSDVGQS